MARDYKHIASSHARRRQSPPWVWLLAGLVIGLFIAFLVYLGGHEADNASAKPQPPTDSGSAALQPPQKKTPGPVKEEIKQANQTEPSEPKFEFYTILPEMEIQVPEHEVTAPPRPKPPGSSNNVVRSTSRTGYVLQVGSFRRHQDADRLKAQLALIGLQADIQVVSLGAEDTWHRVRLGPYQDLRALDETRARLSEHNMQAIVLKEKN